MIELTKNVLKKLIKNIEFYKVAIDKYKSAFTGSIMYSINFSVDEHHIYLRIEDNEIMLTSTCCIKTQITNDVDRFAIMSLAEELYNVCKDYTINAIEKMISEDDTNDLDDN